MFLLTLIRILRDILGLIAALTFVFAGLFVRSEYLAYFDTTDWRLGEENQVVAGVLFLISLSALAFWFLVRRKERAMADRLTIRLYEPENSV